MLIKNADSKYDRGGCSTVIIGKNASVTGYPIVGHTEDDEDCIVHLSLVPALEHDPGETLSFADADALIPEAEKTNAYFWSEIRCMGGASFGDGFLNEYGLLVLSNSCRPGKVPEGGVECGLGYALRRLVAERAKSAKDAVRVAGELVEKYGYISSRTYIFADKDEVWAFAVPTGHNFAARRVGDDEIFFMPNWFNIHEVDMNDKDHEKFWCSETLITNAMENGWYTPKTPGDFSDFDFASAYQDGPLKINNLTRALIGWETLCGKRLMDTDLKPFSVKAERKYSSEDVKKILSSHGEGTTCDLSFGGTQNPHVGQNGASAICCPITADTTVTELAEEPELIRILRGGASPCLTPFAPVYPLALSSLPENLSWLDYKTAQDTHFSMDESELKYDPEKSWWTLRTLQFLVEQNYTALAPMVKAAKAGLEAKWEAEKETLMESYCSLADEPDVQLSLLSSYSMRCFAEAAEFAGELIRKIGEENLRQRR